MAAVASFWGLNKHNFLQFTSYNIKTNLNYVYEEWGEGNKITKCLTLMIITSLHLSFTPIQFEIPTTHIGIRPIPIIIEKKTFSSYLIYLLMIKSQNMK